MRLIKFIKFFLKVLIGFYILRFALILYVYLDNNRYDFIFPKYGYYSNGEDILFEILFLSVNIIPLIIIVIAIHKVSVKEFKKDFLIFRPNFLTEVHLLIRRIFSIISNFVLLCFIAFSSIGLGSYLIQDGLKIANKEHLTGPCVVQIIIISIYTILWLIKGLVFWLVSSVKEQKV